MGFIDPSALAFSALAAFWLVLAWRQRRRRVVVVPALFLWKDCPPPARRRVPPHNWLVILQLAALAALVLSLARPYTEAEGPTSGLAHLLVLDRSASMQANEAGRTRWQLATDRLHEVLNRLPPDAPVTLVTVADQLETVLPSTRDHEKVWETVQRLEPYDSASRLASALAELQSPSFSPADHQLVVFSDFADPDLPASLLARVQREAVGRTDRNLSIEEVRVEQHPWQGPEEARALITVQNHSQEPLHALLSVKVEGAMALQTGLTLDGRSRRTVPVPRLPRAGWLVAELGATDALATDNVGWAWVRPAYKVPVCLWRPATQDGRWLRAVVEAVPSLAWAGADCRHRPSSSTAVHVFWRRTPPVDFPEPALIVAPPATHGGEQPGPLFSGVRITDWDARHPVLGEAVPNLRIPLDGIRLYAPAADDAVFLWGRTAGAELPLAWSRTTLLGSRQVWVAVDLNRQLDSAAEDQAWPLLFLQALAFLSPEMAAPKVTPAGSPAPIPEGAGTVRVVGPGGELTEVPPGTTWFIPRRRGEYTLQWANGSQALLVTSARGSESDIAPKLPPELQGTGAADSNQANLPPRRQTEWTRWLLGLAALLLAAESWLAGRRVGWSQS